MRQGPWVGGRVLKRVPRSSSKESGSARLARQRSRSARREAGADGSSSNRDLEAYITAVEVVETGWPSARALRQARLDERAPPPAPSVARKVGAKPANRPELGELLFGSAGLA